MDFSLIKIGRSIQWTNQQIEYIIDQYVNYRTSLSDLSSRFLCDRSSIKSVLQKNNIHSSRKANIYTL